MARKPIGKVALRAVPATLLFGLLTWACVREVTVNPDAAGGTLRLQFDHRFGDDTLRLNEDYVTAAGDTVRLEALKYYVSNVRLRNRQTGALYLAPDSYRLVIVGDDPARLSLEVAGVTPGIYTELAFAVGVDNASNTSIDKVGDLDPANEMAWSWKTGYKFFLLEGSYRSDTTRNGTVVYHIGGDANYRVLTFRPDSALAPLHIERERRTVVTLRADVGRVFDGFRLDALNFTMFEPVTSGRVADNYADHTFSLTTVAPPAR